MGLRVLVTGGAGFIGSHVSEAYLHEGWEVTALDDLSSGKRANVPEGVEFGSTPKSSSPFPVETGSGVTVADEAPVDGGGGQASRNGALLTVKDLIKE